MEANKKNISADIAQSIQELNNKIVVAKELGLTVEIERFSTSEPRIKSSFIDDNLLKCHVYEYVTY